MCLGKVFVETEQELSPYMENVTSITVDDGELVLTSLLGERKSIVGELMQIDFNKSKVVIKPNNVNIS